MNEKQTVCAAVVPLYLDPSDGVPFAIVTAGITSNGEFFWPKPILNTGVYPELDIAWKANGRNGW